MSVLEEFLSGLEGFEWNAGNSEKNWRHHEVRQTEAEQVLLNRPLLFVPDAKHSRAEPRHFTLGRTDSGRELAIVFTIRSKSVRVISARPMSRAERRAYAKVISSAQGHS